MSVRKIICYVVECDDCRALFDQDAEFIDHFATADYALSCVLDEAEWTIEGSGHLRCRRCSALHRCAQFGHAWDFWAPCHCGATVASHAENGCPMMRMCLCCGHLESANLAELPTIDEPSIGC